jgi:hypothetical protein
MDFPREKMVTSEKFARVSASKIVVVNTDILSRMQIDSQQLPERSRIDDKSRWFRRQSLSPYLHSETPWKNVLLHHLTPPLHTPSSWMHPHFDNAFKIVLKPSKTPEKNELSYIS